MSTAHSKARRTSNKSVSLLVRLSPEEKEGFAQAAELAGIGTSAWMRERLRMAAIRELESAGKRAPFVPQFAVSAEE